MGIDCFVLLGSRVTCTNPSVIYTAERTFAIIGDDVMIATKVYFRCEDSHAIYDVESGDRVNPSKNIIIGEHVWLADEVGILPNTSIGEGSIIGTRALAKGNYPNNTLIVGMIAKVVKHDVVWERAHTALTQPLFKHNAKAQNLDISKQAWNKTDVNRKKIVIGEKAYKLLNEYIHLVPQFDFSQVCMHDEVN
ncbi:hypothetical protein QLH32_04395 [Acinetobacter corruptisaponis]|uniref:Acyltransferase n=1 Tax=Acinetobacter corruptisaponis TaxID=3045147 RepID=A0ABY8S4T7_9GAMM|nr:hypothetical protein [Acinetobacter sp. KCTC 92772]WHP06718.1 hypothetical protein QLH32_04395 [Acinetobacter sp. KCTC 92772]